MPTIVSIELRKHNVTLEGVAVTFKMVNAYSWYCVS